MSDDQNDPKESLVNKDVTPELPEEECNDWGSDSGDEAETSPDPEKGKPLPDAASPAPVKPDTGDGSLFVAICTLMAAVPALIGSWCWPILVGAIFAVAAGNVNGGLVKFFHGVQVAIMFALMTNIVQFAYWNVKKKRKKQGHWYMYQPVYLLMLATILVLLQPTCMLIIGSWICDGTFSADQIDLTGGGSDQTIFPCTDSQQCDGVLKADTQTGVVNATGYWSQDGTFTGYFDALGNFKSTPGNSAVLSIAQNTFYSDGCNPDMQNFFFDGAVSQALVPNTVTGWMIQIFGTYLGFACMFVGVCQATLLHVKIANKWNEIRGTA